MFPSQEPKPIEVLKAETFTLSGQVNARAMKIILLTLLGSEALRNFTRSFTLDDEETVPFGFQFQV
jgi:hypothetical protein